VTYDVVLPSRCLNKRPNFLVDATPNYFFWAKKINSYSQSCKK